MPSTAGIVSSGYRYNLGDAGPAGGKVIILPSEDPNSGGYYYEIPPNTWSGGAADPNATWGCSGTSISTSGSGYNNTINILNNCATAGIAARICGDLSYGTGGANGSGTYDDWFLPNISELDMICGRKTTYSLGFANSNYSTSSEFNSTDVRYVQMLASCFNGTFGKSSNLRVRPLRRFIARKL